jgi:hypothetical protein
MAKIKFKDIKPDSRNTNKHTEYGMHTLDNSLEQVGIIESVTISNDNVIISGNARHEKIGQKFTNDAIIVETDGTTPVVIKRTDIESGTKEFHKASILANTVAQKNQNIDVELVEVIANEFEFEVEEVFVDVNNVSDSDEFGTDFNLPDGDKAPFQQMTFTLADEQAEQIKNAISDIKQTEEYKYAETMGNENSNGNALYLIVMQWAEQRK